MNINKTITQFTKDDRNNCVDGDLAYHYFIVYAHDRGFGNIFLTLTEPMDTSETITQVHDYIGNKNSVSNVILLDWKRIRR